jgi:hypothetical protein
MLYANICACASEDEGQLRERSKARRDDAGGVVV